MYHACSNLPCSRYTNEMHAQARSGRAERATLLVYYNYVIFKVYVLNPLPILCFFNAHSLDELDSECVSSGSLLAADLL